MELSRFLAGCDVHAFDEEQARRTGLVLARTAGTDIVDASVVVLAQTRASTVLTSDQHDLERLAQAIGGRPVGVRALHDLRS